MIINDKSKYNLYLRTSFSVIQILQNQRVMSLPVLSIDKVNLNFQCWCQTFCSGNRKIPPTPLKHMSKNCLVEIYSEKNAWSKIVVLREQSLVCRPCQRKSPCLLGVNKCVLYQLRCAELKSTDNSILTGANWRKKDLNGNEILDCLVF